MREIHTDVDASKEFINVANGQRIYDGATVSMAELVADGAVSMSSISSFGEDVEKRVQWRLLKNAGNVS